MKCCLTLEISAITMWHISEAVRFEDSQSRHQVVNDDNSIKDLLLMELVGVAQQEAFDKHAPHRSRRCEISKVGRGTLAAVSTL